MFSVLRESLLIKSKKYENWARVHFIPDLKVGVFVTLRAPDVIKLTGSRQRLTTRKGQQLSARFESYAPADNPASEDG